jgi:hypothetical protein
VDNAYGQKIDVWTRLVVEIYLETLIRATAFKKFMNEWRMLMQKKHANIG